MLTKREKTSAFMLGARSIYDLYPPQFRIVEVKLRPLPEVSLEDCREGISMHFDKAMKRYEQETFTHQI
jgi:hypothetical protein